MSIQAMKQALEALEDNGVPGMENVKSNLRAAIEAAEKVEPVARCIDAAAGEYECLQETNNGTFLYTHQQPAIPAGLRVIGYLDGRDRFFYADDPLMTKDHNGMRECYAAPKPEKVEQFTDQPCKESDGCPTELAVLQRFWWEAQKAEQQEPVAKWDETRGVADRLGLAKIADETLLYTTPQPATPSACDWLNDPPDGVSDIAWEAWCNTHTALHKSSPEMIWLQVDPEAEQFDGWGGSAALDRRNAK